jgi:hypothetical protein
MMTTFHPLRALALAAALASSAASAQTVAVSAQNAFGVAGGTAIVDIDFAFAGTYRLLSANLTVGFDAARLQWDRGATTLSVFGSTRTLDDVVTDANSNLIAAVQLTAGPDSFSLSARPFNPPPLNSVLSLHVAFTLLPTMVDGASTNVTASGRVAHDDFAFGIETPFSVSARVATLSPVPEPSAAWLLAAGLIGVAGVMRRCTQG